MLANMILPSSLMLSKSKWVYLLVYVDDIIITLTCAHD